MFLESQSPNPKRFLFSAHTETYRAGGVTERKWKQSQTQLFLPKADKNQQCLYPKSQHSATALHIASDDDSNRYRVYKLRNRVSSVHRKICTRGFKMSAKCHEASWRQTRNSQAPNWNLKTAHV